MLINPLPLATMTTTTLEISVVSTEGLKQHSSCFSRIRPFITLTKLPAHMVYYHYDGGGTKTGTGTGEHVFRVPVDPSFFSDTYSRLHLQLYNKGRFEGPTQVGWCLIPPSDIAHALLPPYHSVSYLSYRLRAKDGSRTHFIVNLSIRLHRSPDPDTCQPVIGIPVTAVRKFANGHSSSSSGSTSGKSKMETEF